MPTRHAPDQFRHTQESGLNRLGTPAEFPSEWWPDMNELETEMVRGGSGTRFDPEVAQLFATAAPSH